MMDLHKKAIPLTRGSLFDCRSSTKTAHETSTTCAVEWLQSTVHMEVDVCSTPGLSKKRATAKLIVNSLRRVVRWGVSSAKTVSEESAKGEGEGLLSTVYLEFDVCPPP